MCKKEKGLYGKFNITRTDGRSDFGEKHYNCSYFVLDLSHDKFSVSALRAYAEACKAEYPQLAKDLLVTALEIEIDINSGDHPSCDDT